MPGFHYLQPSWMIYLGIGKLRLRDRSPSWKVKASAMLYVVSGELSIMLGDPLKGQVLVSGLREELG